MEANIVHIMVAISYGQPVLIAEPFVKMNGQYFESFIDNNFNSLFQRANNNDRRYRLWVQDGDPSQNSAQAKRVMSHANTVLLSIPARSPDINPIENIFYLVWPEQFNFLFFEPAELRFSKIGKKLKKSILAKTKNKLKGLGIFMFKHIFFVLVHISR